MNRKWATAAIIILILIFIGYIVYDSALRKEAPSAQSPVSQVSGYVEKWIIEKVYAPGKGQLNAVSVTSDGDVIAGGDSFLACYKPDFSLAWELKTENPVTAITNSENRIYAAVNSLIEVFNTDGSKLEEWGPFESNLLITSVAANASFVAFADAQGKAVYILDKGGVVKYIIGKTTDPFLIPSGFFDIALDKDNNIYAANTGKHRIEKRDVEGKIKGYFGEAGSGLEYFCGCCNPAHFALINGGFITAEKGINRLKILDTNGNFTELVSAGKSFIASVPLDVASNDGNLIYAANPADSRLYVFKRK